MDAERERWRNGWMNGSVEGRIGKEGSVEGWTERRRDKAGWRELRNRGDDGWVGYDRRREGGRWGGIGDR